MPNRMFAGNIYSSFLPIVLPKEKLNKIIYTVSFKAMVVKIYYVMLFLFYKSIIRKISGGSMEKAMAPHSSNLAWKITWTEEPGGLRSMGLRRVGHDWATPLSLFTFMHWRRKWQPTPVFLPGESQGQGSLVGWRLWGCTELDTTEAT